MAAGGVLRLGPMAARGRRFACPPRGEVVALEGFAGLLGTDAGERQGEDVALGPRELRPEDRRSVLEQGQPARPAVEDRRVVLGSPEGADTAPPVEPAEAQAVLAAGEVRGEVDAVADLPAERGAEVEGVRLGDGEVRHHHQRG